MEFTHPEMLYAMILIPLLAIALAYGAGRRRKELARFAGHHLADMLAPGRSWRRDLLKGILLTGSAALMVAALAGPRLGRQLVKVEREGIDLVIALDTSLSMLAEDMKPNRLERAKMEIIDLIRGLKGDRVGLVVFAGEAFPLCPLTVDYDAALMFANAIDVNVVSEPGTAIGKAIERSLALFENSTRKDRAVILVTDGESHEGDPMKAAGLAREKGVKIYAIGIGHPSGELIPLRGTDGLVEAYKKDKKGEAVMTRLDETMLLGIARTSGGMYMPATREGIELKVLYSEIEGMEKKKIKGEFIEQKKERFMWFLAASFILLVLELFISTRSSVRSLDGKNILHTGVAILLLAVIIALCPRDSEARNVNRSKTRAGNRYYENGAYDKALVLYRQALGDSVELPRHYEGIFYNEGNTYFMMGKYQEALEKYQKSLGERDSLLTSSMLHNRGNTLVKMEKPEEAVASYAQALEFIPDDPDVIHNLELALRRLEQQKQQKHRQSQDDEKQDQETAEQQESQQQDQPGQQNEQDQEGGQEPQENPQESDSTASINPAGQDTTSSEAEPLNAEQVKRLSREDALRILQALAEQEKNLQREKKKAAFKKIKKSGKDW